MVQLFAKFRLIDDFVQAHRFAAVDKGKCRMHILMQAVGQLQHEQLIKIGVQ